jgi:L-fuculose-phosphate aldolase
VAVGTSVLDAFDRLEVLESTAEAVVNAMAVGPLHPMDPAATRELLEAFS